MGPAKDSHQAPTNELKLYFRAETRSLSLIDINGISFVYLLMRIIASFLRDTGYQNSIKDPISNVFADSSSCTTTELSIILTSCLTAFENHVIKYFETVFERNGENLFWSVKNSGEILNKLKCKGLLASSVSTYDFSTLFFTLPHNLIKENLTELIERSFNRDCSLYLACNEKRAFVTSEEPKKI